MHLSGLDSSKINSDVNDTELMRRVVQGDHAAFAMLVKSHTQQSFGLAFRTLNNHADAEDVVQSAFIKLWQNPTSWRPRKSSFTTWFYKVVLNTSYDKIRSRGNAPQEYSEIEYLSPSEDGASLLEETQESNWQQHCLAKALSALPGSQRDAINLVVYSQLPQKQAARILGLSLKALESLLVRAKKTLKKSVAQMSLQRHSNYALHVEQRRQSL